MYIAICEDNLTEAEELKVLIEKCMPKSIFINGIDIFENAEALFKSAVKYELVIFDCRLDGMNGVEAAKHYRTLNRFASIIFVTAYIEFAAGGYETDALRYLLKPVDENKLMEALEAFEGKLKKDCIVEISGAHEPNYVKSSEIVYIEALGRNTLVRLENTSVESHFSLRSFEERIRSDAFYKASRRFLVNMKYIKRKNGKELYMENGEKVEISRRRIAVFNEMYANFLKYNS